MSEMSEEVFEITDFTTASDWERFVSNLEEIITQWNNCSEVTKDGQWRERRETIRFAKISFSVVFHYCSNDVINELANKETERPEEISLPVACIDLMRTEHDFRPKSHCLFRWFGLRQFIVLMATDDVISTEDRARLLLSSASIALSSTNCSLPVFFQLGQRVRKLYSGVCLTDSLRTDFSCLQLRTVPNHSLRHLSGLLSLFKDKLKFKDNWLSEDQNETTMLSIRFTYALNVWPQEARHGFAEEDNEDKEETTDDNRDQLAFFISEDPVVELQLGTLWPQLSEEVVVDTSVHSDLLPNSAPIWSLRVIFGSEMKCSLSQCLSLLLTTREERNQLLSDCLGSIGSDDNRGEEEEELRQVLQKLTNPLTNSSWNRSKWSKEQIIRHIFEVKTEEEEESDERDAEEAMEGLKSAPKASLTWRIGICLAKTYFRFKERADLAHLWQQIICHLRLLWEDNSRGLLPHLSTDPQQYTSPDLSACLLHQKLQMFNCCLWKKRQVMTSEVMRIGMKMEERMEKGMEKGMEQNNDSEEEFFDCDEEQNGTDPEGRLEKCGNLKLLRNSCECLYIPITQESSPMTEDMVSEQMTLLSRLGTSSESASLRARLQSASLASDMEAFKAANPCSVFEDFIRWHSPRDWIQTNDSTSGQLSSRFKSSANLWLEIWEKTRAVPVKRQKPLFDYQKEAEKILHYFLTLSSSALIDLIVPVVVKSCLLQLHSKTRQLDLLWDRDLVKNFLSNDFQRLLFGIRCQEMTIHRHESLLKKFAIASDDNCNEETKKEIRQLVLDLIQEPEVQFPSFGLFGELTRKMFAESQQLLYETKTSVGERLTTSEMKPMPEPVAKEFILRASVRRPHPYSRAVPQRMYCLISDSEFRISSAFSRDLNF